MHELTLLLARARADEVERTSRRRAERPRIPEVGSLRARWRRVR